MHSELGLALPSLALAQKPMHQASFDTHKADKLCCALMPSV